MIYFVEGFFPVQKYHCHFFARSFHDVLQSPGEVLVPEVPLVVTTPESEETTPEPHFDTESAPDQIVEPEVVEPEPTKAAPPPPPSPRKPAGSEIQSLSELISSFSPKTEAESSFSETTTAEVAGTSRAESPTVEERLEEQTVNLTVTGDLSSHKDIGLCTFINSFLSIYQERLGLTAHVKTFDYLLHVCVLVKLYFILVTRT